MSSADGSLPSSWAMFGVPSMPAYRLGPYLLLQTMASEPVFDRFNKEVMHLHILIDGIPLQRLRCCWMEIQHEMGGCFFQCLSLPSRLAARVTVLPPMLALSPCFLAQLPRQVPHMTPLISLPCSDHPLLDQPFPDLPKLSSGLAVWLSLLGGQPFGGRIGMGDKLGDGGWTYGESKRRQCTAG